MAEEEGFAIVRGRNLAVAADDDLDIEDGGIGIDGQGGRAAVGRFEAGGDGNGVAAVVKLNIAETQLGIGLA